MKSTIFKIKTVESAKPLIFNSEKCIGCNKCVNVCPIDILIPALKSRTPPKTAYPDECWYCGCCVMECSQKAVKLKHPLMNQVHFVRKETL